ncbi:MAG: ATP-binding protein [Clostridia bacterium]|nr:ATP-binding protein [Clostridia bacterium]
MAYNRENYTRIKAEYEQKNLEAKRSAEARNAAVCLAHPDIAALDRELSLTGIRILRAATEAKGEGGGALDALKKRVGEIRQKKTELLEQYGYPADWCDVKYECEHCSDTGYVGMKMCTCFKRALVMAGYESSGIGALIKKQNFSNFSFDYYSDDAQTLKLMRTNYDIIREYADSFDGGDGQNLLLMGGTGLGKTHLSSAMAKVVIERGYDVLYESAPNIFSDFEQERFVREGAERKTDRYFGAELLIIDDLGTEVVNQYSVSCLYNLINTRINKGLSTVISTNLMPEELYKKYTDRITSRLIGEYRTLRFAGKDIRLQKLR